MHAVGLPPAHPRQGDAALRSEANNTNNITYNKLHIYLLYCYIFVPDVNSLHDSHLLHSPAVRLPPSHPRQGDPPLRSEAGRGGGCHRCRGEQDLGLGEEGAGHVPR